MRYDTPSEYPAGGVALILLGVLLTLGVFVYMMTLGPDTPPSQVQIDATPWWMTW